MDKTRMKLAEQLIEAIDWPSYHLGTTDAGEVGSVLNHLLESRDDAEAVQIWQDHIENNIFVQNTIFSVAEPIIDVLIAALLDERPEHVRSMVTELLLFMLNGASLEDQDLNRRCHERARMGLWVFLREVKLDGEDQKSFALEILELLDPNRKVQAIAWSGLNWS
jgi:hypothetical protein